MLTRINTLLALALVSLVLTACVTINIYFPAAAVEKAADLIIDEVWKAKQANKVDSNVAPAADTATPEKKD
jgi:hypothetical protein